MASLNDTSTRAVNNERNKLNLSGGKMSGQIIGTPVSQSWISGRDNALVRFSEFNNYCPISSMKTTNGTWDMGVYSADKMYFTYCPDTNYNQSVNNGYSQVILSSDGSLSATKVYNAVWNDYAEFYERGEQTEPGDVIQLDINSEEERYIKATAKSRCVVGVHSDEYGHLIGGEPCPNGEEFVDYNLKKFIPVGLVGRVRTKVIGPIQKGDKIVVSDIRGIARKFDPQLDSPFEIFGMALENKTTEEIQRVKIHLTGGGR